MLLHADSSGVLTALVFHTRMPGHEGRDLDFWRVLGWVHLLNPSGIHLWMMHSWAKGCVRKASQWIGIPTVWALPLAAWSSGLLWGWAWLLSGCHPGLLRPIAVAGLRILARGLGAKWRILAPLVLVALFEWGIRTFLLPADHSTRSHGMPLHYYFAVGGGLLALELNRKRSAFQQHFAMAVGSWSPTALLDLLTEGWIQWMTPVVSLVSIPILSIFVYPALLILFLLHAFDPILLSESFLVWIGTFFSNGLGLFLRGELDLISLWVIGTGSLEVLGLVMVSVLFLFVRTHWSAWRIMGVALFLRIALGPFTFDSTHSCVTQLDVGQGDSALVTLPGEDSKGLIDTGSAQNVGIVKGFHHLAHSGMVSLDWVVLTHLDDDHAGSVLSYAAITPIRRVVSSSREWETGRGRKLSAALVHQGIRVQDWQSGDVRFPFLHWEVRANPRARKRPHEFENAGNRFMSAILIPLPMGGFYFGAGDADARMERDLISWFESWERQFGLRPGPRILKLSHHGSKHSSDLDFLRAVRPTEAWISVGARNLYRHPSVETLQKLGMLQIPIRRTDLEGSLHILQ